MAYRDSPKLLPQRPLSAKSNTNGMMSKIINLCHVERQ